MKTYLFHGYNTLIQGIDYADERMWEIGWFLNQIIETNQDMKKLGRQVRRDLYTTKNTMAPDAYDEALKACDQYERDTKEAFEIGVEIFFGLVPEDLRFQYASYVYWEVPEVQKSWLNRYLPSGRMVDGKRAPRILPRRYVIRCTACGTMINRPKPIELEIECPSCEAYLLDDQLLHISMYSQYRGSKHWKAKREKVLKRDKHRCTNCGARRSLHVHHMTYERIGCERMTDLVTLCAQCHEKFHDEHPHYWSEDKARIERKYERRARRVQVRMTTEAE